MIPHDGDANGDGRGDGRGGYDVVGVGIWYVGVSGRLIFGRGRGWTCLTSHT